MPLSEQESGFAQWAGEPIQLAGGGTVTELLLGLVPRLWSVGHWEQVAGRHVVEPVQAWLIQTHQKYQQEPQWLSWRERFLDSINPALQEIRAHLGARQQRVSDEVRARLLAAGYPPKERSLSRMALDVLAGLEGLSCVLAGMRRREYVDDALRAEKVDGVDSAALLARFNSLNT
jgi:hypothetical protein